MKKYGRLIIARTNKIGLDALKRYRYIGLPDMVITPKEYNPANPLNIRVSEVIIHESIVGGFRHCSDLITDAIGCLRYSSFNQLHPFTHETN